MSSWDIPEKYRLVIWDRMWNGGEIHNTKSNYGLDSFTIAIEQIICLQYKSQLLINIIEMYGSYDNICK